LARRLVDSQFPQWSNLPITAVEFDGWDNRSFRLGSELIVRLPSGNWYAQQVGKEQQWLPVLAPQLPLPIPTPVAKGTPDSAFPYPWSVYRFLDGDLASKARIGDLTGFATTLARFLNALGRVDATGGPEPGQHNFFRGGPLATYEHETLKAIDALVDEVPSDDVKRVSADAMATWWDREPVWFHGDVATGNLRIRDERLTAVLDFGSSGVGDPRLRHGHRLDVPVGIDPEPLPGRARRGFGHVVARPRLGAVEGADLAGRPPRTRCAGRRRGSTRHRPDPRRLRAGPLTRPPT
jgi:aminoglycoside phosphotransferase (APT) family kinase protein